jgi:hypothetical protein
MTWGETIKVFPNISNIDTVFFKEDNKSPWDTIICNIQESHSYVFVHNDCCGGFNVSNESTQQYLEPKVTFCIETSSKKLFLGKLGNNDLLAKFNHKDTLKSHCYGAMSSNICHAELLEIEMCKGNPNCKGQSICENTESTYFYEEKKSLTRFLYMPLENETLSISFNPKTGKQTIHIR